MHTCIHDIYAYIYIYIYNIYICIYTCIYIYIFKLFMLKIKMSSHTIFPLHILPYSLLFSTRIFHYHKERTWIGLSYIKSALNWWTWLIKLFPPTFLTISILPPTPFNYFDTPFHILMCHNFEALPVYFDTL